MMMAIDWTVIFIGIGLWLTGCITTAPVWLALGRRQAERKFDEIIEDRLDPILDAEEIS